MNAAILQRLIWKEYRVLRSFWLAMLVLTVAASATACLLVKLLGWRPLIAENFFFFAAVASCLYSLGVGGMSFATEHELSTADFLRRLPLDARHLLISKVAASVLSLVGLKLVLWFVASLFWMITEASLDVKSLRTIWLCGLLVDLEFFAWGAICSLLSRQPLMAITWGVMASSVVVHILLPNIWRDSQRQWGILRGYEAWMLGRAMFAMLLLAAVVVLSEKWIRSAEPLSLVPDWLRRFSIGRRVTQERWLARKVSATPRSQLLRLIWLQWRQSHLLWAALSIPFVLCVIWNWSYPLRNDDFNMLFVVSTGILCGGLGVSVFHGEQVRSRFRFFAERGIPPARVWWGHQLLVLIPLVLVTVGYLLVLAVETLHRFPPQPQPQTLVDSFKPVVFSAVTIFATAQLAGMLVRNPLVASAATLVAFLVQLVWLVFVLAWSYSDRETELVIVILGFLPLFLGWLWISRWYAGHWILERKSRAVRLRLCAWFLTPWLLAACGIMAFRVLEIPGIGVEPPTREELLTLSDEERQTAVMYQSVCDAVGLSASDSVIADRLRESNKMIEDLIAASLRPTGAIAGDLSEQRRTVEVLFRVFVVAESQAGDANDFERSLELCSAAMRVLEHWRHSGNCLDNMSSRDYERQVLDVLRQRLKTVALTADQYRDAARRVASWDRPFRSFPRNCGWSYREALDRLRSGWQPSSEWKARWAHGRSWFQWIPGERARACRLLRLEYMLARADPWRGEIKEVGGQPIYALLNQVRTLRWKTPSVQALIGDVSTYGVWPIPSEKLRHVPISARNRMLQTRLELQAMKIELGEWPPTSESLQRQDLYGDWIEYRPHGILGTKSPQPIVVRGLNAEWSDQLVLRGDEPCLVYFRQAKNRMPLPDALITADDKIDHDQKARSLIVELLDVSPPR